MSVVKRGCNAPKSWFPSLKSYAAAATILKAVYDRDEHVIGCRFGRFRRQQQTLQKRITNVVLHFFAGSDWTAKYL
jgi:hypothetical protein